MSHNDNFEYDFGEDGESDELEDLNDLHGEEVVEETKEKSREDVLMDATRDGDIETVRTILSSSGPGGVETTTQGYERISLLFTASGSASLAMVKLLVEEFGADVTALSELYGCWSTSEPALNAATMRVGDTYQYDESEDKDKKIAEGIAIIEYLISQGADVNFNRGCYSPIINAITYPPAVSFLISHGAKLNLTDSTATPVYYAVLQDSYESLKILLLHGSTIHPDVYRYIAQSAYEFETGKESFAHFITLLLLQQYIVDEGDLKSLLLDRFTDPEWASEYTGEHNTELKNRMELYLNSRYEFVETYAYDPKYQLEWPKPHPGLPFTSFSLFPPPFQRFLIFLIWCHRQSTSSFSSLLPELLWHEIVPFLNIYSIVCSFRREGGEDDLMWKMLTGNEDDEFDSDEEEEFEDGEFEDDMEDF